MARLIYSAIMSLDGYTHLDEGQPGLVSDPPISQSG